ncbi:hypothetical protein LEP1GSC043_1811 [Leptospira weilii str. Ecochallenge]|uniref:Uncharacterized protein n=1 Tax=Leptospira weilii str. Ecochallenge TaxID=1049986 RepID=N1U8P1_9LEPT|nr:hypothetical protein LEP1GSC043_1811 [Leptospira weilii str. Ecochallenge]
MNISIFFPFSEIKTDFKKKSLFLLNHFFIKELSQLKITNSVRFHCRTDLKDKKRVESFFYMRKI